MDEQNRRSGQRGGRVERLGTELHTTGQSAGRIYTLELLVDFLFLFFWAGQQSSSFVGPLVNNYSNPAPHHPSSPKANSLTPVPHVETSRRVEACWQGWGAAALWESFGRCKTDSSSLRLSAPITMTIRTRHIPFPATSSLTNYAFSHIVSLRIQRSGTSRALPGPGTPGGATISTHAPRGFFSFAFTWYPNQGTSLGFRIFTVYGRPSPFPCRRIVAC